VVRGEPQHVAARAHPLVQHVDQLADQRVLRSKHVLLFRSDHVPDVPAEVRGLELDEQEVGLLVTTHRRAVQERPQRVALVVHESGRSRDDVRVSQVVSHPHVVKRSVPPIQLPEVSIEHVSAGK
jgi:hypothetical protein